MQEYDEDLDITAQEEDQVEEQQETVAPSSESMLVESVAIEKAHTAKRGRGRPDRRGRYRLDVTSKTRVPVGGYRDILTIENTDPDFHYFWELDSSETGPNIHTRLRAGYDFVRDDEGVVVGQASVFQSEAVGSILRVPNGDGRYLYLMKIPMDWYLLDQAMLNDKINETESTLRGPQGDGTYGEGVSIRRD